MRKFSTVLLLIILLCPLGIKAQSLTNRERRQVNAQILSLIDEYERYAVAYDEEAEYGFLSLFASDDSPVFCDLIGMPPYLTNIPVSEYLECMRPISSNASIVLSDVRKLEMTYTDQGWVIPVKFKKNITYMDYNGCAFSVNEYYGKDIEMTMTVLYDPDSGRCRIERIDGKLDSEVTFPEGRFYIVNRPDESKMSSADKKYKLGMLINDKPLTYNAFDQAMIEAGVPDVDDIDVIVTVDTLATGLNYDVVDFRFVSRKSRLKLRYGIAPFSAYNVSASDLVSDKSNAMEFGLDYGVTWKAGKKSKMGFNFGAALSQSSLALSLNNQMNYAYMTSVPSGNGYFKSKSMVFDIQSAAEKLKFTDLMIPLYFEVEHSIKNHVLISWNFGLKTYLNLLTKYEPFTITGSMSITDELSGKSEETFSLVPSNLMESLTFKRNPLDFSAMANVGVDINLYKNIMYLSVRGGFEYGFTQTKATSELDCFSSTSQVYPVMYNPLTEQYSVMQSFISSTSYRRQAVWLDFGVKFKM